MEKAGPRGAICCEGRLFLYTAVLHLLMGAARDDIELLLARQVDELHGIAGHADREIRVLRFLRMLHAVDELIDAENIDVEVMRTLAEVAVHDAHERRDAVLLRVAERLGRDGLRVRDAVERVLIRQFRDGVQRSQEAVLLGAVRRVRARGKRRVGLAAVGQRTRGTAVDDVRRDGQDGRRGLGIPVCVMLAQLRHEGLEQPDGNLVGTRIVVAVFREVALHLVVDDEARFVADCRDLGVLDGAEGIDDMREAGDARRERAAHIGVDEGQLGGFTSLS